MLVKKEHYAFMKASIVEYVDNVGVDKVRQAYIVRLNSPQVKDAKIRLAYDLARVSMNKFSQNGRVGFSGYVCEHLYTYCNDTHITTALKSICNELELYEMETKN